MQHVTSYPAKGWARIAVWVAGIAALAIVAEPSFAQQQSVRGTSARSATAPIAFAVFAEQGTPNLDGKLDDPIWQTAEVITGFTQVRPNDGSEPSERTEVRIVYDSEANEYTADPDGTGPAAEMSFSVFDEFGNLLRDDQQNTFLVKVNYWLSR